MTSGMALPSGGRCSGVLAHDELRQGALRLRVPGSRDYFSPAETGAPRLVGLPLMGQAYQTPQRALAGRIGTGRPT
jgi:hypothetical protein